MSNITVTNRQGCRLQSKTNITTSSIPCVCCPVTPPTPPTPPASLTCFTSTCNRRCNGRQVNVLEPISTTRNTDIVIHTRGTGALMVDIPNGTVNGGVCRGEYAVDLQSDRFIANQVAAGDYSVIGGGLNNRVTTDASVIDGGRTNTIIAISGTINNQPDETSADNSNIGGGFENSITATGGTATGEADALGIVDASVISGGTNNTITVTGGLATAEGEAFADADADADNSVISGGFFNRITVTGGTATADAEVGAFAETVVVGVADNSVISGGINNTITVTGGTGGTVTAEVGAFAETIAVALAENSVISGGTDNTITVTGGTATAEGDAFANANALASASIISGGTDNTITATGGTVTTAGNAFADADNSVISGGTNNTITATGGTAANDGDAFADADALVISGGIFNRITAIGGTAGPGEDINAIVSASVISGGVNNRITADASVANEELNTQAATIGGGEDNAIGLDDFNDPDNPVYTSAEHSVIPGGLGLRLTQPFSAAVGRYNFPGDLTYDEYFVPPNPIAQPGGTSSRIFMVGNGTGPESGNRRNAMSVTEDGVIHAQTGYAVSTADYAEWFESVNGQRLEPGTTVVSVPDIDKIAPAKPGDIPFGVISATPGVLGNSAEEEWTGKYQHDKYGRKIRELHEEAVTIPVIDYKRIHLFQHLIHKVLKSNKPNKQKQHQHQNKEGKSTIKVSIIHSNNDQTKFKDKSEYRRVISQLNTMLNSGRLVMRNLDNKPENKQKIIKNIESHLQKYKDKLNDLNTTDTSKSILNDKITLLLEFNERIKEMIKGDDKELRVNAELFIKEETKKIKEYRFKLSPNFDRSIKYIPRSARPEWNPVGLLGRVRILRGQPVSPNWIKLKKLDDEFDLWLIK